jgi:type II secretory pathway component PulF
MIEFTYQAIDQKGKTRNGKISAGNSRDARKQLSAQSLTVLKLGGGESPKSKVGSRLSFGKLGKKKSKGNLETQEKGAKAEKVGLAFLKRLLELHASGMPVADAVKLLNQRLSDPSQKYLAGSIWRELAEGRTLSRAMRLLPGYFSESSSYVIEAGEATGNLSPILEKIINHLEEKREIRSRVISGMAYPVFVGLIALGVVLFFLFFLLPQIQEMLASLGGELNLMAKILINGSNVVLAVGPFVLVGMIVILGILKQLNKTESGGMRIDRTLLQIPLFGRILFLSELFQLSSLLSTLIWSGIGLTENLRLCERTIKNRFLRSRFRAARALVNEGRSLPDALRKFEFMPLMQLDVLEVGEKTGNLGNSLNDTAKTFREELTKRIKVMTNLISGLALGFAFSLVALVAVSIVTSIFQVSKSISY